MHIPHHVRLEAGSFDGLEGEGQIVELVDDVVYAFVPVSSEDVMRQAVDDGVDVTAEDGGAVRLAPLGVTPVPLADA